MKNIKINGKWDIWLPKHRAERPEWFTDKGWERARLDSMHKHLSKDDLMFYVGAEEGDMAALCQMWGAKMVLFEPNPKVWSNIKAIWKANKLEDPLLCYVGFASNKTSTQGIDLIIRESVWANCANGKLIADHGFMELHNHNAPEIKIDDIEVIPTAISIDVEGSEWQVLRGAEQTLRKYHPKIWLSLHPEFMFRIYGEYQFDLRAWIKNLGYKETLLDYQHEVHLMYEKN
jgi:FkbM family methyltransferase